MNKSFIIGAFFVSLWLTSVVLASPRRHLEPQSITTENDFDGENKIYNGSDALRTYPFYVAIMVKLPGTKFHLICGGSLIDRDIVLTAGHCTVGMQSHMDNKNATYEAWLAPTTILQSVPGQNIPIPSKGSVFTHRGYDSEKIRNDIGLIRLSKKVDLSSSISTICLKNSENWNNIPVILVGFGDTKCGPSGANDLQIATGKTISYDECVTTHDQPDTVVCATLKNSGNGYAEQGPGDSGGPIFSSRTTSTGTEYFQVGLVSYNYKYFADGCPVREAPGVYTIPSKFGAFFDENNVKPTYC